MNNYGHQYNNNNIMTSQSSILSNNNYNQQYTNIKNNNSHPLPIHMDRNTSSSMNIHNNNNVTISKVSNNFNHNNQNSNKIINNVNNRYKVPKNMCQSCYETSGRFILDCYCIICEKCYNKHYGNTNVNGQLTICSLCGRSTKGNKIDAKQQASMKKIGHLFQNVDVGLQKMLQIYKFQTEIVNRYCQYLQKQLNAYQSAVGELVSINPNMYNYFNARVKLKRSVTQTTQPYNNNYNPSHSISSYKQQEPTVKPSRQYASQIYQSRRSTIEYIDNNNQDENSYNNNNPSSKVIKNGNSIGSLAQMNGMRPIGRAGQVNANHSGNAVYKVPNINYNTAVRTSKRAVKNVDKERSSAYQQQYESKDKSRYKQINKERYINNKY